MSELTARIATDIGTVSAPDWDACAQAGSPEGLNPFVSHAFLNALERSGSVGPGTGWSPLHLLVEDATGALVAAAPCYVKAHSMGEYVFDHAFADAYTRAGGRYYPKLQVAVPFTPATGPRLLVRPRQNAPAARAALIAALIQVMRETRSSSLHVTFPILEDVSALAEQGFLQRTDQQFHWFNRDYDDFEGFLEDLASRKRKAIRRERRDALAAGLIIERLTGADLTERHWDDFFAFYMDTGSRKWGRPYLTRRFFSEVGQAMADKILLIMVRRGERYIAGAINFIGETTLYGRNWGCVEDHPFLHFEVCYYQAIDFAIERGLSRVEAGAQGEHKLARGYVPVQTQSAHLFADPGLQRAAADYLKNERRYTEAVIEELAALTPFKRGTD